MNHLVRAFLLACLFPMVAASQVPPGLGVHFGPGGVLDALARAYPDRIVREGFASDVVLVDGKRFAWADGRLLLVGTQAPDTAPQPFYEYPRAAPDVATWTPDQLAQAEQRLADRTATNLKRSSAFFDALWGVYDRSTADQAQRSLKFLSMAVNVHYELKAPLARVEARLNDERAQDPSLDRFLAGLDHLEGFNWRAIAGTQSRSNHSYGTAIDVIPKSFGGKNPYWLWAPQGWSGWYRQAWTRRWQPHPKLVEAFEAEGFVWGGKWLLFDTIHFEYRPEILVLNGLR